jgi:hypothetical protein
VAPPAAKARGKSNSLRRFIMTPSIRNLRLQGMTMPTRRLTIIINIPSASLARCCQIRSLASRQALEIEIRFFFFSAT